MIARITSIENLIANDPGGRNVFAIALVDQLRLAAQSLRLASRVGIVTGFYVPEAQAGETDGPSGAKVVGRALEQLGVKVDYITDTRNAPILRAIGIEPTVIIVDYLDREKPTHLLSIERVGRGTDGRYRNMRGVDVTETTTPLDALFLEATRRGLTTIGIGDGGNEIGMGKVFGDAMANMAHGPEIATIVATDFCIAAGVSNWGAYGLAGALSVLAGRDLLPTAESVADDIVRMVRDGGAVDGITCQREPTVDRLDISHSLRMLEDIRRQTTPSPLESNRSLTVGILGYGISGRAAAKLLVSHGHQIRISDTGGVSLEPGIVAEGVETGGHSIGFLQSCELVVASPGVRPDADIRGELHRQGIPVMSELEFAFQLCSRPVLAVTGTVGKRTTVELLQELFRRSNRYLTIGGNRGEPLSSLVDDGKDDHLIALAVSSFQLESVVSFRPDIAIILNIDEEHLDRHRTIAEYVRTKSRVFMNHHPNDSLVLPFDDPRLRHLARQHRGRTFFVSPTQEVDRGAWLRGGELMVNVDGSAASLGEVHPTFPDNLLSAVVAARLSGIESATLAESLANLSA